MILGCPEEHALGDSARQRGRATTPPHFTAAAYTGARQSTRAYPKWRTEYHQPHWTGSCTRTAGTWATFLTPAFTLWSPLRRTTSARSTTRTWIWMNTWACLEMFSP